MQRRYEKAGCRWQLNFQRNISVARWFPLRSVVSKPQSWLPSLQHQNWKGTHITSSCENSRVSVCQGEAAGDADSLLKDQSIEFHLQPLTLGTSKRRAERTKRHLRRVWGWWVWGEKWRNSHQDPCAKSFSTGRSYYLRQNTLL